MKGLMELKEEGAVETKAKDTVENERRPFERPITWILYGLSATVALGAIAVGWDLCTGKSSNNKK